MKVASKGNRVVQFVLAFIALLFCGLIYAWSLFVDPLEAEFGWTRSQTSLNFTISLICFSLGMLAAGWLDKRGHTSLAMNLGVGLAAGGFIASSFTNSLLWIYLTYGVAVGLAAGFVTDVVMAVVVRWFPDRQGFVSGALLMGFGIGSMVLGPLVTMMLANLSWRSTFLILGIIFGVVFFVVGILMREPPFEFYEAMVARAVEEHRGSGHEYPASEMMKTSAFWVFIVWLILVSSGGLGLISQAVPAANEVLASSGAGGAGLAMMATAAMGSVSLFNGLGRFLNGFVWDRFGYKVSVRWISVAYIASMGLCAFALMQASFVLIVLGFMLLGLVYGANMSAMAAMTGGFFGTKYYSVNYAVSTCQMIISASVGPLLLASLQGSSGSYFMPFCAFFVVAIVALIVSLFVHAPKQA